MAVCPKCEKKIPIYHLGQMCPHCGVNMRFYNFDKNFYRDAKRAELSNAKISIFISHVKASLIGSKLAIIRLCTMILPLLTILVPYANASIKLPMLEDNITISGLGLYMAFMGGYVDFIPAMLGGGADGACFTALVAAIGALVAVALFSIIILLLTILCFTSIKKMPKVLCVFSVLGIISAAAGGILSLRFAKACEASNGVILSGSISFGWIVSIIGFIVPLIVNLLIIKKGLNIEYKEGDLERVEIAKKVKAGEINLDDLPQPIVETAETRLIDEEIAKQQKLYREKENKEGSNGNEEV